LVSSGASALSLIATPPTPPAPSAAPAAAVPSTLLDGVSEAAANGYNVLLYVIDTTRADHLSLYGYERETTPFLEQVADEGILLTNYHSTSTWTWPSVVSMITGTVPQTHKVLERTLRPHPGIPALTHQLEAAGYSTALLTSNTLLEPTGRTGDLYQEVIVTERPDQNLTDTLVQMITDPARRPFFIQAQPFGPHAPYIAEAPWDSLFVGDPYYGQLGDLPAVHQEQSCEGGMFAGQLIDGIMSMDWYVAQYDGLIAYIDYQIEELFQVLESEGLRDNTLVIIIADHGEELAGDHNFFFCHIECYEGNTHVPALVFLPRALERKYGGVAGRIVDRPYSHIDLMPFILGTLGLQMPVLPTAQPGSDGRGSLNALSADHHCRAFYPEQYKVINHSDYLEPDPALQLFDIPADPAETTNLTDSEPTLARDLESEMHELIKFADRVRPPEVGPGILFETDFSDPDGPYNNLEVTSVGTECRWKRVAIVEEDHNWVMHGRLDPSAPECRGGQPFRMNTGLIFYPLESYAARARMKLIWGEAAMMICWRPWMRGGYVATFSKDHVTLTRVDRDGSTTDWGAATVPFAEDEWHWVRLEKDGGEVRLKVDGEVALSAIEPEPHRMWGTTYFSVATEGGEVLIDDLSILK
jgi:arylsulfatase A-like enzyme